MSLPKINAPLYELVIPSIEKKIKYRPFTVKEEKLLLLALEDQNPDEITDAIIQVINNCIQGKIDIDKLSTFDVEYMFLKIRSKSVGEDLEFSITCPDDGETQVEVVVNIDDIKVVKDDSHTDTIDLENGYFIKMKYPTVKYITENKEGESKNTVETTFNYAVDCIEQIYNSEEVWESANSTRKEMVEFVEGLNGKQYEKIQQFFSTMPKLKHVVKVYNPNTKVESDVTIEGLANFFA